MSSTAAAIPGGDRAAGGVRRERARRARHLLDRRNVHRHCLPGTDRQAGARRMIDYYMICYWCFTSCDISHMPVSFIHVAPGTSYLVGSGGSLVVIGVLHGRLLL